MMARVIGLGAGGPAKAMIAVLVQCADIEISGLLDVDPEKQGGELLGVPVLGGDELLSRHANEGCRFFIGVGGACATDLRRSPYKRAIGAGLEPISIVHPTACIPTSADVGRGLSVLAGAVIGANAVLTENVLVNRCAVAEHDVVLNARVHAAVSATVLSGAVVEEGAHIGARVVVGAGPVVVRPVRPGDVAVGLPARPSDVERADPGSACD